MSAKSDRDKSKQLQDKCMSVLNALLRDEDNKYCVDCDSKGPRWASWNLGVFLCIRCAGIHRNLGVHISKVKSVNLDSWTPEQVVSLQQMGNSRARAVYEANLPDNFRRPQNDSSLETFIRAKYEHKKYIAREWVPPALPEVNWEKEIDEEIERQKRKKKTVVEKKTLGNVEVPQLPKPKNASPKPGRPQNTPNTSAVKISSSTTNSLVAAAAAANNENKNTDLLGLQNNDDSFSNFLSAPVNANNGSANDKKTDGDKFAADVKSEEESFFNQTAPSEKEKAKLTKDSIMALYGATPTVSNFPTNAPVQQQFKVPPTMYPQQGFPQQQAQNFNQGFAQQNFVTGNGFMGQQQFQSFGNQQQQPQQQQQQQQQQYQFGSQFAMQQQQQPNQYQFQNQFANSSQMGLMQSNNQFAQFQMAPPQAATGSTTQFVPLLQQQQPQQQQQPAYYNQIAFQQQFSNLALNDAGNGTSPSITATNIWQ